MVSFLQAQCLNCGKVEDLPRAAGQTVGSWCSQCSGFTRPIHELVSNPPQLFHNTEEREDEELISLFSKKMILSQPLQQQQKTEGQQQPAESNMPQQFQSAVPPVNFSISQHYHHYRPVVAPPSETVTQAPQPKQAMAAAPSGFLEQLQRKATQLRTEAYSDYHRQLQEIEDQYNRQHIEQQSKNPGLIGSPVSTAASINDDYQLQMFLLEQERQNVQLQQDEEQTTLNQFMAKQIQQQQFMPQQENGAWSAGQPIPPKPPADPMLRTAQDFNNFYYGYGDSEMMDSEESHCVIYPSRNYRMQHHFI